MKSAEEVGAEREVGQVGLKRIRLRHVHTTEQVKRGCGRGGKGGEGGLRIFDVLCGVRVVDG